MMIQEITRYILVPSQILVIGPDGQKTLDGNSQYYHLPEYQFDKYDNDLIQNKFNAIVKLGKEYKINIGQFALFPVKYETKGCDRCVGLDIPEAYDFSKAKEWCRVMCVPLEVSGKELKALKSGALFGGCHSSIDRFAKDAAVDFVNAVADTDETDFRKALRLALAFVSKARSK
ncbi:MAG: hypothetical protein LBB23_03335 [Rickettsiales bacterium]|jgi:hypothetical protein|nr:hypothetical protein [Rickettsiales bacterium]